MSLILYFTTDEGERYVGFAWSNNNYSGARDIPIGQRVEVEFEETKKTGKIKLSSIKEL